MTLKERILELKYVDHWRDSTICSYLDITQGEMRTIIERAEAAGEEVEYINRSVRKKIRNPEDWV